MNDFKHEIETLYAKSNPEETIRQHTDNLKKQAELLKKFGYIQDENLYQDLLMSCEYHDYGKMNDKFQQRLKSKRRMSNDEIPHNVLSAYFIEKEKCHKYENVFFSVLYHHVYGESPYDYTKSNTDKIEEELRNIFREDFQCKIKQHKKGIRSVQKTINKKTVEKKNSFY